MFMLKKSFLVILTVYSALLASVINTDGQQGAVRTISAKPFGIGKLTLGLGTQYAFSEKYVSDIIKVSGGHESQQQPSRMLSANLALGMGITPFIDLAGSLPVYYDWPGFGGLSDGGLGDIVASIKLYIPITTPNNFLYHAYYLAVTVPSGMPNSGYFPRHPYYAPQQTNETVDSDESFYRAGYFTLKPLILWTFDFSSISAQLPLDLTFNVGSGVALNSRKNTAVGKAALTYNPIQVISLIAEISSEIRWSSLGSSYLDVRKDPIWFSPALEVKSPAGFALRLGADISLSSTQAEDRRLWPERDGYVYKTNPLPEYGINCLASWRGFLSYQDSDRDGITNIKDQCPKEAEDFDTFEDEDGCPDLDNDKDGIPDLKDKCPNKAEDFDASEDEDGCPDLDNDKDGIPDTLDKCPNEPEDSDNFKDEDGCPDPDNDKDGIADLKDKCPNEAETFNGVDDDDGCPDQKKECPMPKQQILQGVDFRSGSADMSFFSLKELDDIVQQLKDCPEIELEIRGHTDSYGKYDDNVKLSQMRAEAVRQYIISKGIDQNRIRAIGFGPSSPIADNKSAEGRAKNRRIEIIRLK